MTHVVPDNRIDLNAAIVEINQIQDCIDGKLEDIDPDFIAERIIGSLNREYEWNRERMEGRIFVSSPIEFIIKFVQHGQKIIFYFNRTRSELDRREGFGTIVNKKIGEAAKMFEDAGWSIEKSGGVLKSLTAKISVKDVRDSEETHWKMMAAVADRLLASFS